MRVRSRSPLSLSAPEPPVWQVRPETPQAEPGAATDPRPESAPVAPAPSPESSEAVAASADPTPETATVEEADLTLTPRSTPSPEARRKGARLAGNADPYADPAKTEATAPSAQVELVEGPGAPAPALLTPEAGPVAPARPRRAQTAGVFSLLIQPHFLALLAAVVWAAGVCAFAVGYEGGGAFDFEPFRLTVLILLALGPVPLLFGAAQLIRRSADLTAETRRAYAMTQAMVGPTTLAAGQTAEVIKALRDEIAHAAQAAERARAELAGLREAMSLQGRELDEVCDRAGRSARATVEALSQERAQMSDLGQGLDRQAAAVIEATERQALMVRDASDLAQTQLREAEAALAARAADLAAAAGEAQDAARLASDDLARQTLRLETAGSGVAEQIRSVEEGLSQQRAALVQGAYQLRADQEDFSAQVETQRAQMVEVLSSARTAASELGDASSRGAEALRDLIQAAGAHFRDLAAASEGERAGFEARLREGLEQFAALAAAAQAQAAGATAQSLAALTAATDQARAAADAAAEAARSRVDGLGEAAFEAGRRAEEAYETRMAAARRLIEESSTLVEAAGARATARLTQDFDNMTRAIGQVESALAEIDGRAARLPDEAKARIDEIRAAVEQGLGAVADAARRAAAETEAAEAGFHERVKRNYDMLTEAVRLMGVVSGETPGPGRRREEPASESEPALPTPDADAAEAAGLRGKLRLTRHTGESEVRTLFEAPGPKPDGEGWTWRDLLGGIEPGGRGGAADDDGLTIRLVDEIKSLGVDPHALLPRGRVEEAALAWLKGEAEVARQVVRRVAPAAVRRISRRILTDKTLRGLSDRYVARYTALIGAEGATEAGVIALLGSEAGRTFLLIDAAVGSLTAT